MVPNLFFFFNISYSSSFAFLNKLEKSYSYKKNLAEIFIEIALNLYITLDTIDSFIILSFPNMNTVYNHLFRSCLIFSQNFFILSIEILCMFS